MNCSRKIAMPVLSALIVSLALFGYSCVSTDAVSFKRDKEFVYGIGTGKTEQDAAEIARNNLIASGLAETTSARTGIKPKITITSEVAKSFKLPGLPSFITEKKDSGFSVVLRYPRAEWEKMEDARQAKLRSELESSFSALSVDGKKSVSESLTEAGRLFARLSSEGVFQVLTENEESSVLFSDAVETHCEKLLAGLIVSVNPGAGFVSDGTRFEISIRSKDGKPVLGIPLSLSWQGSEGGTDPAIKPTDPKGMVSVVFPADPVLKNQSVRLLVSVALSSKGGDGLFLKEAEDSTVREFSFRHFSDVATVYSDDVKIPGGAFMAGALSHDKRAEPKEAPRKARVSDFYMDKYPVTNDMFRAYLEDMNIPLYSYPDYWDNPEYNKPGQPVIGISLEEANAYAEWISRRFGIKKRLPNEDEWERAAHGGVNGIYPWGDQLPTDTVRANYNGNKRFDATSPVGSFENGKNPFGLYDMAGNVSQWTSTTAGSGEANVIVKGGSWMDGPGELRVSSRRDIDPAQRYADVGFRLVREIGNE